MEVFKGFRQAFMDLDAGKRNVLMIKTGNPGEHYIISSKGIGTGLLKIQTQNKGKLTEGYTKNLSELF